MGDNLEDLLKEDDDEIHEELSIIFTKKNKVFLVTPETTVEGIENTSKLLAHLIINWAHNIAEKMKTLEGANIVVPKIDIGLSNKIFK